MSDNNNNKAVEFDVPRTPSTSIIKVIGVGGGGGNAVNHMYKEGIHDVSFALCNTDKQVLDDSPIPTRLQMGPGLGAGGEPEKASEYAEASLGAIHELLDDGTQWCSSRPEWEEEPAPEPPLSSPAKPERWAS